MKILIINQPLNNRGDEAAHKALLRALINHIPNIRIRVLFLGEYTDTIRQFDVNLDSVEYVCLKPRKATCFMVPVLKNGFHFLWNLHPTTRKMIEIYKWADWVVCAPGGICMGGFQNWTHLFYLYLAKYVNKPLAYFGRSFGPFPVESKDNMRFKAISMELLNYFAFCSIRDKKTESIAIDLKVNYKTTLDTAFLESPIVDIPKEIREQISTSKYVVFVPNALIWHYAYKNKTNYREVISFYNKMVDIIETKYCEHNIVLLPQTFNYLDKYANDVNFFRDLKKEANRKNIIVIDDIYSSDIQQSIIKNASCVIGARYHSVVFSINQCVPFVALSYEHKISGMLETLNKTDCMVDITKAFDNKDSMEKCILDFEAALNRAFPDISAMEKAKRITTDAFMQFVKIL